jgi:glycosyltransferase involved in cell wall biosynthesis
MDKTPKISIIIPVYNSADSLQDCLEAIAKSEYENFETILVDDNSSDNSIVIAKQFNCHIIQLTQNSGPAYARNEGAKQAAGEILLFSAYRYFTGRKSFCREVNYRYY